MNLKKPNLKKPKRSTFWNGGGIYLDSAWAQSKKREIILGSVLAREKMMTYSSSRNATP